MLVFRKKSLVLREFVMSKKSDEFTVKVPLGVKLAAIIGIIILVSLGCVTVLNSYFIGQDVQVTAENNNLPQTHVQLLLSMTKFPPYAPMFFSFWI